MDNVLVVEQDTFSQLMPIDADYATLPIQQGFNWIETFAQSAPGEWYLVVFRSQQRPDANKQMLQEHDERAYLAALRAPGFVHYFGGTADGTGNCLSFCLWKSQQEARAASQLSDHQSAQRLAGQMYQSFSLERYRVWKAEDSGVNFERL